MGNLYPLKFAPSFKERLWGGNRLHKVLNKPSCPLEKCGESWELSAVEGHVSVVANGFLAGNNLQELVEVYMGDLVGDKVYDRFGIEFPLLIKFIDAEDDLSIQVHPNDELSKKRHSAYGKTEMWYVVDADPGARLISGFNQEVDREKYISYLQQGRIQELLLSEEVFPGDVFFIPAGRVHAIGKGILLAEIQQTSDVTYRIFDFNRVDKHGKPRKLHTDLALDAIDFSWKEGNKVSYNRKKNSPVELAACPWFTTNLLELDQMVEKDFSQRDTFVIYMGIGGDVRLVWRDGEETIGKGETALVPAVLEEFRLEPLSGEARLLEVYID